MCGRYAFYDPKEIFEIRMILEEIADVFGASVLNSVKQGEVYPTETAALLAQTPKGHRAYPMQWGYTLPNKGKRIINARTESVLVKPMFARSVPLQKCAIPCTGFFEWQSTDDGKLKHLITTSEPFFYLGGLYNRFKADKALKDRFVILTQPASIDMQRIHHRMPLIIPAHRKDDWLHEKTHIAQLLDELVKAPKQLAFKGL